MSNVSKHTQLPWVSGYGEGITGPTTPSNMGVTCGEYLARKKALDKQEALPSPKHYPITVGMTTIAIVVSGGPISDEEMRANADFVVKACNNYNQLLLLLDQAAKSLEDYLPLEYLLHKVESPDKVEKDALEYELRTTIRKLLTNLFFQE